jgi:hypothetical protein
MYTDPSGNNIADVFFNIITFPAKLLTEGITWLDDKINGWSRPNGYFNLSYLSGRTEPGKWYNHCPANIVPYGHPLFTPPITFGGRGSVAFGTGRGMSADNEWNDITARPILLKLSKRLLYKTASKLGIDPGKPIPPELRTVAFVNAVKFLWFRFAPNPKGIIIKNFKGGIGAVDPANLFDKFLGWSTMYLHEEKAFTGLNQLFYTLGHELVHVAQFLALKGEDFGMYDANFRNALDFYARDYTKDLGYARENIDFDLNKIDNRILDLIDHRNYIWTKFYMKPF